MRALFLLVALLSATGCIELAVLTQVEPVVVEIVAPAKEAAPRVVEQPGLIQADEESHLQARVPGYLEVVHVDIGQKVQRGDVLAELSVPEVVAEGKAKAAQILRAEAEVAQARKAFDSAEANVRAVQALGDEAQAGILRAEANTQRWALEAQRIANLVQRGILDAQTRDETNHQYAASLAGLAEARARVISAQALVSKAGTDRDAITADVEAALARVVVAKAEADRVGALLGYARITAPYAGIITRRRVNTGDFVQPAGNKGDALFTIARLDKVRAVIPVPEADAVLIADGDAVKLTVPALKETRNGTVTRTSWSLEPGARTLRVEIDLANPGGRLRPGVYVTAQLTAQAAGPWLLPTTAIAKQGDGHVCYTIEGEKAVRVAVQVGASKGRMIEVTRLGAASPTGHERIAASAAGLSDGAAVRVK